MSAAQEKAVALYALRELLHLPHPPDEVRPATDNFWEVAFSVLVKLGYVHFVNEFWPYCEHLERPELTWKAVTLSEEAKRRLMRGEWPEEE